MNAKEALRWMENDTGIMSCNDPAWPIAIRAIRLLAAAEANDGTTPETDEVLDGWVPEYVGPSEKGLIDLCRHLERERNGLAARVAELEPDAERYQFLRECAVGASAPNEITVTWTIRINDSEHGDFDAAIDAARSKP